MGLFKKKEITKEKFKCITPFGNIRKGNATWLELFDDHIAFTSRFVQDEPITLKYSKITNVDYVSEWEKYEKDRSPIGRAIVGQALFGDTGAQVGAISGLQKRKLKNSVFAWLSAIFPKTTPKKCCSLKTMDCPIFVPSF